MNLQLRCLDLLKSLRILKFSICLFIFNGNCLSQNLLTVPFGNGFAGDNTGNNASSNSIYLSALGWSNIQFAQSTNTTTFVSQGNDIIGMIYITDANGVEHIINGYVKWRAPSGTVTCLVFAPSNTKVLATNGSNGSSTYTISPSKYIGLIFNGKTLTIASSGSNAGQVTGNAATTGLLNELNSYLSVFPSISAIDYTVNESVGSIAVTVTLSSASTSQVKVNYVTSDVTATSGLDYTAKSGQLIFNVGETSLTLTLFLLSDLLTEPTESFRLILSDGINASISKSYATINIEDNPPLPVELVAFNATCSSKGVTINWSTSSEYNSHYFIVERSTDMKEWVNVGHTNAQGLSNSIISYIMEDFEPTMETMYYRLTQYDMDGKYKIYDPVALKCPQTVEELWLFPNPAKDYFSLRGIELIDKPLQIQIRSMEGMQVYNELIEKSASERIFDISYLQPGMYFVIIHTEDIYFEKRLTVQ
jgi:hypothetical protein